MSGLGTMVESKEGKCSIEEVYSVDTKDRSENWTEGKLKEEIYIECFEHRRIHLI